ncbi:MAG: DHHW family protein [Oscillospiraceae bacterium]|nr:DHHW family protein [Oscillospiraceae bacterium]
MKNFHQKILVILFTLICVALPVLTFIFIPKEPTPFSENENRFLSASVKPDLSGYIKNFFTKKPNNIKSKQFMNGFDSWFADRFILREDWIVLQNELETLQGKTEINGVFIVGDKMLQSWRGDSEGPGADIGPTLNSVDGFAKKTAEQYGTESYIMLVPTAQEIYADLLPANAQPGNQAALIKHCYDHLEHLTSVGVMTYLSENSDRYIYYRTDHHWTTYGAYWGYYAAAKNMGITPYELGRFNIEHAASDFRGTLFSKTLNFRITPDVIQFYTLSCDTENTTRLQINNGNEITEYDSLYLREYLDKKDKYAAFMGLNSPIMDVFTDVDNGKSLLIFKDSFAHCMIPFLANHYSRITVLDMRYINTDIEEFVALGDYGEILFVYSVTNFAEDSDLRKLAGN